MKGIETWKNPNNSFTVLRLHYTADPAKNEEWKREAKKGFTSEAQWEQEMEINFDRTTGRLVYDTFDRDKHTSNLIWNPELPMLRGWDFGYRNPACCFTQVDKDGRFLILRTLIKEDILIHDFAKEVLKISYKYFPMARWYDYGDPGGNQANDKSEQSSIDILAGMKIYVQSKKSGIKQGLNIIRWYLGNREGLPIGLIIDNNDSTQIVIDAFEGGYHFPEDKDSSTLEEIPEKDGYYDHIMDAIRYVAIHRLKEFASIVPEVVRMKTVADRLYDRLTKVHQKRRIA